jgi:hypothetical protein
VENDHLASKRKIPISGYGEMGFEIVDPVFKVASVKG